MYPKFARPEAAGGIDAAMLIFIVLICLVGLVIAVIGFIGWGMIFKKAGYSFALAILMLLPVVNLIWFLVFAFSKWPILTELEARRRGYAQPAAPPGGPPASAR